MKESNKRMLKIFALPFGIFLFYPVALFFEIRYAIDTDQPVMDKDYYEVGSHYDTYMKEQNTGDRILLSSLLKEEDGGVTQGENKIRVEFRTLKGEKPDVPVEGGTITLRLERPATVEQSQEISCTTDSGGHCNLLFHLEHGGSWEMKLKGQDARGGAFTRMRRITVPES